MNILSPSLVPSTPKVTHCHRIYARYISLSSIHSVCIMLFILSPLIRWSYIYAAPFWESSCLQPIDNYHWMISHQYCFLSNHQPHSGIFNNWNIMPFFILSEKLFFPNIQPFSMKWKRNLVTKYFVFAVFNTYQIYHAPPYIANTIRFANTQIFSQF